MLDITNLETKIKGSKNNPLSSELKMSKATENYYLQNLGVDDELIKQVFNRKIIAEIIRRQYLVLQKYAHPDLNGDKSGKLSRLVKESYDLFLDACKSGEFDEYCARIERKNSTYSSQFKARRYWKENQQDDVESVVDSYDILERRIQHVTYRLKKLLTLVNSKNILSPLFPRNANYLVNKDIFKESNNVAEFVCINGDVEKLNGEYRIKNGEYLRMNTSLLVELNSDLEGKIRIRKPMTTRSIFKYVSDTNSRNNVSLISNWKEIGGGVDYKIIGYAILPSVSNNQFSFNKEQVNLKSRKDKITKETTNQIINIRSFADLLSVCEYISPYIIKGQSYDRLVLVMQRSDKSGVKYYSVPYRLYRATTNDGDLREDFINGPVLLFKESKESKITCTKSNSKKSKSSKRKIIEGNDLDNSFKDIFYIDNQTTEEDLQVVRGNIELRERTKVTFDSYDLYENPLKFFGFGKNACKLPLPILGEFIKIRYEALHEYYNKILKREEAKPTQGIMEKATIQNYKDKINRLDSFYKQYTNGSYFFLRNARDHIVFKSADICHEYNTKINEKFNYLQQISKRYLAFLLPTDVKNHVRNIREKDFFINPIIAGGRSFVTKLQERHFVSVDNDGIFVNNDLKESNNDGPKRKLVGFIPQSVVQSHGGLKEYIDSLKCNPEDSDLLLIQGKVEKNNEEYSLYGKKVLANGNYSRVLLNDINPLAALNSYVVTYVPTNYGGYFNIEGQIVK